MELKTYTARFTVETPGGAYPTMITLATFDVNAIADAWRLAGRARLAWNDALRTAIFAANHFAEDYSRHTGRDCLVRYHRDDREHVSIYNVWRQGEPLPPSMSALHATTGA